MIDNLAQIMVGAPPCICSWHPALHDIPSPVAKQIPSPKKKNCGISVGDHLTPEDLKYAS